MPPRLRLRPSALRTATQQPTPYICTACRATYASLATTPSPPQPTPALPPIQPFAPTQPPSHKPPEFRKSQLHRQYQSLLRSSPLILLFQHNNIKATEWTGIRRELAAALRKVDADLGEGGRVGDAVKLQIVQTGIFASALKVVEFWEPKFDQDTDSTKEGSEVKLTHGLSKEAWEAATRKNKHAKHGLEPLLSGPIALLTIPEVSPQYLKAALSILAPSAPNFPAPKRRTNPGYHEKAVQDGLQKLMLLGARIEGKVFDVEGAKWVGGIEGGLTGLRAQLVAMLSGVGAGITNALEGASRSLYFTMESRKVDMEEAGKPKDEAKKEDAAAS